MGRTGTLTQHSITTPSLSQVEYNPIVGFITDVLDPDVTAIPAGLFDFNIWASSNTASQTVLQLKVYKYDGATTTATLLATSDDVYTYDGAVVAQYIMSIVLPQTSLTLTDRLYILLSAKALGQNKNITLYFGGNTPSHVHTTFPSVGGSGLIKVINGVMQNPASLIVDSDISGSANIAGSKIQTNYFALASATGSFVTTGQTGVFALAANTGSFVTTGQTGSFINTNQTGNFLSTGAGSVTLSAIEENIIICSSVGASGLINFDTVSSSTIYYTPNSTANFYLNLRGNSSCTFNSLVDTNKTLTATFLNTNGSTAYPLTGISIDGTGRTIKWLNGSGTYPAGNTGSIDMYSITAIKTGDNLYTIFGSQGKFV